MYLFISTIHWQNQQYGTIVYGSLLCIFHQQIINNTESKNGYIRAYGRNKLL